MARWRQSALAGALLLVSLATGCGGRARGPNLVLVSVDTLRADQVGASVAGRATTPALERLAQRGTLFVSAQTVAPWTLPAHASLLTGLYPTSHGVKATDHGLPEDVELLAERLAREGWRTAGIVNSVYLSSRYGFQRGFRDFRVLPEPAAGAASGVFELAAAWLEERGDGPFFLFLHDYQVHSDYGARSELEELFLAGREPALGGTTEELLAVRRGRATLDEQGLADVRALYAAGVRQMDEGLALFLARLEELGLSETTIVCVTSDHGEEFLEHGDVLHGRTQFEEILRVPLVLAGPGIPAGRRPAEPVSLVDVVPTLLGLLQLESAAGVDGTDLRPLLEGRPLPARVLFGEADHSNRKPDVTRSARSGRFKLVVDRFAGQSWLFDLEEDPRESLDASARHPVIREELERALRAFDTGGTLGRPLPELDEGLRRRLEALGY